MARHDGVELAYETFGPPPGDPPGGPAGDPLLLITGIGMHMLDWPEAFCAALVDRGFTVARFDNRDAGLSTHLARRARRLVRGYFFSHSRLTRRRRHSRCSYPGCRAWSCWDYCVVMIMPGQLDMARELRQALGRPAAQTVLPLVTPAVMLVGDPAGTSLANPQPQLPDAAVWPSWQGQPMELLLDLDLAAVQRVVADSLLPADGRLLVFSDAGREQPIPGGYSVEDAGSGVLVHVPAGTPTRPVAPPTGMAGDAVRLGARPGWSLPSLERRVRGALAQDDDAIWAYYKFYQAMSIAYPLRWGQVFGQIDDEDADTVQVGKLAAAAWRDWSVSPGRWRTALTVATELDDNAELRFWVCTDLALPERLDRPWMTVFSG